MNYVEVHLNDYAAATFHLTPLEDGIYWRTLRCYYRDEGPLPVDIAEVSILVGAKSEEEIKAVKLVLKQFFIFDSTGWRQIRCDQEIEKYLQKSKKAQKSAAARWCKNDADANAMPTQCEGNATHSPNTHSPNTHINKQGDDNLHADFDLVWQAYPPRPGRSRANALKAYKARIKEGALPELILTGVKAYAFHCARMATEPRFIKQPETFLGPGLHFLSDWTLPAMRANESEQDVIDRHTNRDWANPQQHESGHVIDGTAIEVLSDEVRRFHTDQTTQ